MDNKQNDIQRDRWFKDGKPIPHQELQKLIEEEDEKAREKERKRLAVRYG
ncbi:MAG: hypothetical protein HS132_15735 [Planctomycetia bacterium]|nr:hypothetical protein [Planctomycetia bacterium]